MATIIIVPIILKKINQKKYQNKSINLLQQIKIKIISNNKTPQIINISLTPNISSLNYIIKTTLKTLIRIKIRSLV